ncbi:branched-chain amino acid ABC transporter ATP-binding protein/permease [Rhodococcus opacus]|nr:branched-chain amino acid ABC transporter ATP-binding protein/permease [Rhodococcus opacus]
MAIAIIVFFAPTLWADAFTMSFVAVTMLLSIVVVTGYAGQLSLAQYALAGLGSLIAGRLVAGLNLPFEIALVGGVLGATVVGLIFGMPALRARGINLAIVTLGLGYAIEEVVLKNVDFSGGVTGTTVGPQTFLGFSIDALAEPGSYALFCLGLCLLSVIAVTNVRRGRAGRRMIAVRTNERAAASLGISVFGAKLYAFALSAALAGLAGILFSFRNQFIVFTDFTPLDSINAVTLAVVGGVGYVLGPVAASALSPGAFPGGLIAHTWQNFDHWLTLIGGLTVILVLMLDPNGLASSNIHAAKKVWTRLRPTSSPTRRLDPSTYMESPQNITPVAAKTLEVSDVTVKFGGVTAVSGVSLNVAPGEIVGLIGPNGAGKTTLIDAITGFVRPAGGSISLGGEQIDGLPPHLRARRGLSRSFQSLELFDDVTVLDNIRAAADKRDGMAYLGDLVWPRQEKLSSTAAAAIEEFELEPWLDRPAEELPYAQRRLVAIARAAAMGPSVLLLDEPAAGLGEAATAELAILIRRLATKWGLGVLLVEHDMSFVMGVCDRVVVLEFGKKLAEGTPDEVIENPAVISAYLGDELHHNEIRTGVEASVEG